MIEAVLISSWIIYNPASEVIVTNSPVEILILQTSAVLLANSWDPDGVYSESAARSSPLMDLSFKLLSRRLAEQTSISCASFLDALTI